MRQVFIGRAQAFGCANAAQSSSEWVQLAQVVRLALGLAGDCDH
jgi:hypothetical protein